MSASRWAMCPRCRQNRRKEAEAAALQARAAYGTVPVEEFQALHATAEELAARVDDRESEDRTFREDYEITGAAQGRVTRQLRRRVRALRPDPELRALAHTGPLT